MFWDVSSVDYLEWLRSLHVGEAVAHVRRRRRLRPLVRLLKVVAVEGVQLKLSHAAPLPHSYEEEQEFITRDGGRVFERGGIYSMGRIFPVTPKLSLLSQVQSLEERVLSTAEHGSVEAITKLKADFRMVLS
jgi:hypothetical protein